GDPKASADVAALGALSQAVFGETSPLYRSLVLDKQTAVVLMAEAEEKRDPSLFRVLARVRSADALTEVRTQIESALTEAAEQSIDAKRLDAIKAHLRYEFAASLQSPDAVAMAVGHSIAITGRPDAMNDLYAAYDRLTPSDLQRVAKTYFQPSNRTLVILESETKP
ncbi:MAG: insulinase family protein, partial [Isosphaeraceae bacterium]